MKLQKVDAGVWVKASDEPLNSNSIYRRDIVTKRIIHGRFTDISSIEWLKPYKDVYVLTEDELEKANTDYAEWLELHGYKIKGMDDTQRQSIYKQFIQSITQ